MTIDATPKSADGHRVFTSLQDRIVSGDYPPGTWLPTERALADEFGVTRAVIRAAYLRLAGEGRISREPGRRPWVSDKSPVNRRPIRHASISQAGSSNRLQTIAAIMPQHPVYHASMQILTNVNLEMRAAAAPYRVTIFNSHGHTVEESEEFERQALITVLKEKIAGVLIWHVGGAATLPLLVRLQEKGVHVVYVDRYPAEHQCDYVGIDNRESAAEAVRYLISLGHKRIAHLTSTEKTTAVLERMQGYLDALRSAGITPEPDWIYEGSEVTLPELRPAVKQYFSLREPPTALFALNDALAHYFIIEAEAAGYSVPESISVMGFDDLERYLPRPALLTTMHQPFDQIGRRAAKLLLRRLSAAEPTALPNQHVLFVSPLVVRSTCLPTGKEIQPVQ